MDIFPKFIIVGDNLYMGKVSYHKQLAHEGDIVKGGGWFDYNSEKDSFTFFGDSHDFGAAKLEDIQNAVDNGNVGASYCEDRYINHKLFYRDVCGEITDLNPTYKTP